MIFGGQRPSKSENIEFLKNIWKSISCKHCCNESEKLFEASFYEDKEKQNILQHEGKKAHSSSSRFESLRLSNYEKLEDSKNDSRKIVDSTNNPVCYNCNLNQDLIKLDCQHSICDPCLSNLLESECIKPNLQILKCHCNKPIKSKLFQNIVLEDTLLFYLQKLNSFRIKNKQKEECIVCGFPHEHSKTCSEFFNESKNVTKCEGCPKPEDYLLPCGHSYCSGCLEKTIRDSLESDPLENVFCVYCPEGKKMTVPNWMMNNAFGGQERFVKIKESYIQDVILSPKLECLICKVTFSMNKFTTLDCNHKFCKNCISMYIQDKIQNFKVNEIVCPICDQEISANTIQGSINPTLYGTYLGMSIKKYKPKNEKMNWCEKCGFGFITPQKYNESCPNCKKVKGYEPEYSRTKLRGSQTKESEISQLPADVIVCPSCKNGVSRERGCNFVQCAWPICEIYFCAICKMELQLAQHYTHYTKSGPFGKTCNTTDNI